MCHPEVDVLGMGDVASLGLVGVAEVTRVPPAQIETYLLGPCRAEQAAWCLGVGGQWQDLGPDPEGEEGGGEE